MHFLPILVHVILVFTPESESKPSLVSDSPRRGCFNSCPVPIRFVPGRYKRDTARAVLFGTNYLNSPIIPPYDIVTLSFFSPSPPSLFTFLLSNSCYLLLSSHYLDLHYGLDDVVVVLP